MVANLILRQEKYICGECLMRQADKLTPYCRFCGASFSNYEDMVIQKYLDLEDEEC